MPAPTNNRVKLSAEMERRRMVPVPQAAEIKAISEDSFRRHFRHLIRQITPRRQAVMLGDLFEE
jgi:hypothetical protein